MKNTIYTIYLSFAKHSSFRYFKQKNIFTTFDFEEAIYFAKKFNSDYSQYFCWVNDISSVNIFVESCVIGQHNAASVIWSNQEEKYLISDNIGFGMPPEKYIINLYNKNNINKYSTLYYYNLIFDITIGDLYYNNTPQLYKNNVYNNTIRGIRIDFEFIINSFKESRYYDDELSTYDDYDTSYEYKKDIDFLDFFQVEHLEETDDEDEAFIRFEQKYYT